MKSLRNAIEGGNLLLDISASSIESIFDQVLAHLVDSEIISAEHRNAVLTELIANENATNSALGDSIAIPHAYIDELKKPVIYFVRLAHPLNLGAADGVATQFMFFLLGPRNAPAEHLNTLASITSLVADKQFRYDIGKCKTKRGFLSAIDRFQQRHPLQKQINRDTFQSNPKTVGLEFTGKFGGGVREDIARRLPHYWNDFTEGFNLRCVGSILFLFFACLAPAVLFGGLMGVYTNNQIGVIEMILATAVCGVLYALFSGTPLIILGGTGPLLVFTGILFLQCERLEIEFLPTYAWVGIWSSILLLIATMFDCSFLMRYFTRFTDEIFAALISMIFIFEAIKVLFWSFEVRTRRTPNLSWRSS